MKNLTANSLLIVGLLTFAGTIIRAEAPAAEAGPRNPKIRAMILEKFDANQDGKLDDTERAAARAAWEKRKGEHGGAGLPPAMREKIKARFDLDGNGELSETERTAARAAIGEHRKTCPGKGKGGGEKGGI